MSELTEALRAAVDETLEEANGTAPDGTSIRVIGGSEEEEAVIAPGYVMYNKALQVRIFRQLRKAYRRHAGETLPASGEEYLDRTMNEMTRLFITPLTRAIADGVLIGQENLFAVKRAKTSNGWQELFTSEGFRKESELFALGVQADPDAFQMLADDLRHAVEGISRGSGYHGCDQEDLDYLKKIWDLWSLAANSVGIAFYRAGYKVGTQWKERDILAGISAATEDKSEE